MSGVRFSAPLTEPHTYVKNGTIYRVGDCVNWVKKTDCGRLIGEIISIEDTSNSRIKKIAINALVIEDEEKETIDRICGLKSKRRKAKAKNQYQVVEINTNILF